MEDDWDLHAVVRGCNASTITSISSSTTTSSSISTSFAPLTYQTFASDSPGSCFSIFSGEKNGWFFSTQDPFEVRNNDEELHELYKPFFPKSPASAHHRPLSSPATAGSPFSLPAASKAQTHQKQSHVGCVTTPRTKRRKNQMKKVCQVASENLSSDIWAWRKYGQKPIKGSPHPRGYYRCSSSKGCLARKQVERNRCDPGMFIVTYTAEHNHSAPTHRNSLAGSMRQKPGSSPEPNKMESGVPDFSSSPSSEDGVAPPSTTAVSKDKNEDLENNEDDFGVSKMVFEDCIYADFPANFGSPWTGWPTKTAI